MRRSLIQANGHCEGSAHVYYKNSDTHLSYVLIDTIPPLPCELAEGKELVTFLDTALKDPEKIRCLIVLDTTGYNTRTWRSVAAAEAGQMGK